MIKTDVCIIGAGPVGLFAVFEAGLLKLHCHLIDYLPQVGGQLSEIYPKKPIFDIPGYPEVMAQELVDNLVKQIEPFKPTYTLGERVETFEQLEDGSFLITTGENTKVAAKVIAIAGGLGCFEPRKPKIDNLERFEKKGVDYIIKDPEKYRGKKVVIAGGGDSALDWVMYLADMTEELTLVHRRTAFRGAPDSAEKVQKLADEGKINLILESAITELNGGDKLESLVVSTKGSDETKTIEVDDFIPLFGLSPKLGPIGEWGLNITKNAIDVDTKDYSTNVAGLYAIGDINNYEGKLKLILCGFHEAAIMMHSAAKIVFPDKKISLKYTTVNGIQGFE